MKTYSRSHPWKQSSKSVLSEVPWPSSQCSCPRRCKRKLRSVVSNHSSLTTKMKSVKPCSHLLQLQWTSPKVQRIKLLSDQWIRCLSLVFCQAALSMVPWKDRAWAVCVTKPVVPERWPGCWLELFVVMGAAMGALIWVGIDGNSVGPSEVAPSPSRHQSWLQPWPWFRPWPWAMATYCARSENKSSYIILTYCSHVLMTWFVLDTYGTAPALKLFSKLYAYPY